MTERKPYRIFEDSEETVRYYKVPLRADLYNFVGKLEEGLPSRHSVSIGHNEDGKRLVVGIGIRRAPVPEAKSET